MAVINSKLARDDLYIGGQYVSAHTTVRVPLIDPATEEQFGHVPDSDNVDVDRAVQAAQAALPGWRARSPAERGAIMTRFAEAFDRRKDEIVALVSKQNGAIISWPTQWDGLNTAGSYKRAAQMAANLEEEQVREANGRKSIVRFEPVGVVGAIVPWNTPQLLLAGKLGPALAAGCTIVVKPSPETSLDALLLGELLEEAGFPAGVVNIVTGGPGTGELLVAHPGTDSISFTGSTRAGRHIAQVCGAQLKPVTAELGGKSAAVLLDDVDLEGFSNTLIPTCLPHTGQICFANTRVLAPRSRFDEVIDAVTTRLQEAVVGVPEDFASEFGPLVTQRQRDRVEGYIQAGIKEGARIVLGGDRPEQFPVGWYVEPTVFTDVDPKMTIFQEEIFGPVLVVVPHDGDEDAIRLANDSVYGLSGSVFSGDLERATNVARHMETGAIKINGRDGAASGNPYKDSGLGRLGGLQGVAVYQQMKAISQPSM